MASHAQSAKMRPVATDVAWSVCLCVCLLDSTVSPTETAEPIEMPFGFWTRVGPRNHVIGGGPYLRLEKGQFVRLFPPLKCSRLCKQQTPVAARGCGLIRRGSALPQKRGFRMDSPIMWVTSGGSDAAFRQHSLTTNN